MNFGDTEPAPLVETAPPRLRAEAPKVLTVTMPAGMDPAIADSIKEAVSKALTVLVDTRQGALIEEADRLAALAGSMVAPNVILIEERLERMRTIRAVFEGGDWLTAEEINQLQANPPANKSLPASDWKRRGRIYSVNHGGKDYFARYQFDALYQPLPIIKDVLKAFGEVADPWVLAAWFHFPNAWIAKPGSEGREAMAPKDALDQREAVTRAAERRQLSYVA